MVAKVVGRQDLAKGMGSADGVKLGGDDSAGRSDAALQVDGVRGGAAAFPLSAEERNVRMAELRSLGVDLPTDKLTTLLK